MNPSKSDGWEDWGGTRKKISLVVVVVVVVVAVVVVTVIQDQLESEPPSHCWASSTLKKKRVEQDFYIVIAQ